MGITSTITHRLLTLSRSGLILNRGLNAGIIPAFIVTSRSVASAAAAKPTTKTADAATPKTAPKSSAGGRTKATATAEAAGKTGSTTKKSATPKAAAKNPVKKVAAKKELTDEQRKKLLIKQLREKALNPPPRPGGSGYTLWFGEQMHKEKTSAAVLAVEWKALPQDVKIVCLSFRIYLAAPNPILIIH
jgi:hypothetical protein